MPEPAYPAPTYCPQYMPQPAHGTAQEDWTGPPVGPPPPQPHSHDPVLTTTWLGWPPPASSAPPPGPGPLRRTPTAAADGPPTAHSTAHTAGSPTDPTATRTAVHHPWSSKPSRQGARSQRRLRRRSSSGTDTAGEAVPPVGSSSSDLSPGSGSDAPMRRRRGRSATSSDTQPRRRPRRDSSHSDSSEPRPRLSLRGCSRDGVFSLRRTASRRQHRRATSATSPGARGRAHSRPDPLVVFAALPVESREPPPPPALGLPPLTSRAVRRASNRNRYIAVADTLHPGEAMPATVAGYVVKVGQILAHRTYYFPGAAVQYVTYLAWLIEQSQGRSLPFVMTLDAQARTHMAQTPGSFFTPTVLQHFVLAADSSVRAAASRTPRAGFPARASYGPPGQQICELYNDHRCWGPCPRGRRHVCSTCAAPTHRRRDCTLADARRPRH